MYIASPLWPRAFIIVWCSDVRSSSLHKIPYILESSGSNSKWYFIELFFSISYGITYLFLKNHISLVADWAIFIPKWHIFPRHFFLRRLFLQTFIPSDMYSLRHLFPMIFIPKRHLFLRHLFLSHLFPKIGIYVTGNKCHYK